MEKLIKMNELQEITNPITFGRGGSPNPDGLLSTDIFGVSSRERKSNFAYVNLHAYFLHPFIYKILKRLNKKFESVVNGTKYFKIVDGDLVEADEDTGETGLDFLYDNWEKLKFKRNESYARNERIDVLEYYDKKVLFTKYWVIIPAFYRDVNLQNLGSGKVSHNVINDKYAKLIRLADVIRTNNEFAFVLDSTKGKLQDELVEIYDHFKGKLEKKEGMIRKNLLAKSVDYGSRLIITASKFDAERPDDMIIDFYHCGLPLAHTCTVFYPFVITWLRNYFQRLDRGAIQPFGLTKDNKPANVKIADLSMHFTDDYLKKQVDLFVKTTTARFIPVEIPLEDGSTVKMTFSGQLYNKNNPESLSPITRPVTWCDLLYQAAVDVTADKHVYCTRYPMLDYFGSLPNKVTVLSTHKTVPMYVGGKYYPNYPNIDMKMPNEEIAIVFQDSLNVSNLYLEGTGGDFDGDSYKTYWSPASAMT